MNRLLLMSVGAVAAVAAAVPAVAGLAGNPSFSHKVPVRVPSQAQLVGFDDHGRAVPTSARHDEPKTSEPGDDRGGTRVTRLPEPGDDHGGAQVTRLPEPGDDHGGVSRSGGGGRSGRGH